MATAIVLQNQNTRNQSNGYVNFYLQHTKRKFQYFTTQEPIRIWNSSTPHPHPHPLLLSRNNSTFEIKEKKGESQQLKGRTIAA